MYPTPKALPLVHLRRFDVAELTDVYSHRLDLPARSKSLLRRLPLPSLRARRRSATLLGVLLLRMKAFRQRLSPGRAVPLLVRLVLDLSFDEEVRELAPLGLALERH